MNGDIDLAIAFTKLSVKSDLTHVLSESCSHCKYTRARIASVLQTTSKPPKFYKDTTDQLVPVTTDVLPAFAQAF